MPLQATFKRFITQNKLLEAGQKCLLALSGGIDSMVLAHLFLDAGLPFAVAHCNFQLRASDSDEDEQFVHDWAKKHHIQAFSTRFDTKTKAQNDGISTQMAARNLRYDWFKQIALEQGFNAVATAQHLNDSVETSLFNWSRGTGIKGLTGIALKQEYPEHSNANLPLSLIRPLLFASRANIEAYAATHSISWREDSSNASDDYTRNFIRHQIIPLFEDINPNFLHTAERSQARLGGIDANYHYLLQQQFKMEGPPPFQVSKQVLMAMPDPAQALSVLLKPFEFTEEQARQVVENIEESGLDLRSSSAWRLLVDRHFLLLSQPNATEAGINMAIQEDDLMLKIPGHGKLFLMASAFPEVFPETQTEAYVNAAALIFPLKLRSWQSGDHFQPFGMQGKSQKLQDFFTNLKRSKLEKEKALILENGDGTIIWILGYRLDERFRASGQNQTLKMVFRKD